MRDAAARYVRVCGRTSFAVAPRYLPIIGTTGRGSSEGKTTMTSTTTKIYGALIGTGVFFALGTAMAHAQMFCDHCF